MESDYSDYPREYFHILRKLELEVPIPYQTILSDQKLLEKFGSIESISALIYQLLAQHFIEMRTEVKDSGEEDILLILTKLGSYFRMYKKDIGDFGP